METPLFVLWLFFPAPWAFHGLPMSPGWASVAVQDEAACQRALLNLATARPARCVGAGATDPEPLAQLRRSAVGAIGEHAH